MMSATLHRATPGVYRDDVVRTPVPPTLTAIPVFLGVVGDGAEAGEPVRIAAWDEYVGAFGSGSRSGYLAPAVRGFFENGGRVCHVVPVADTTAADAVAAHRAGLATAELVAEADLLCAPDAMRPRKEGERPDSGDVRTIQRELLEHCDRLGDRFAILDALPGADTAQALEQRGALASPNGALYHPWLVAEREGRSVPPSGHVAGIYARSDERAGVHKAPANERVEGIVDLDRQVSEADQALLHPLGVNCLRSFPGRGIRVWGARTLAGEPWNQVNVRRLFIAAIRWIESHTAELVFEPLNEALFARAKRELTVYLTELFTAGALRGTAPEEAFFVRCDRSVNPPEVREQGQLVVEIGLAPAVPNEFVVIRIVYEAAGAQVTTTAG